jgi:excisionase family DNA binding protein
VILDQGISVYSNESLFKAHQSQREMSMTEPLKQDQLLTVREVTTELRISRATAYSFLRSKKLKAVRLGGKTLIRRSELDQFVANLPEFSPSAA